MTLGYLTLTVTSYITSLIPQGLGTIVEEQQENFKSQRVGRTAAKWYLLDVTITGTS